VALFEFILRVPGRPDEVRISDYDGLQEGDDIMIGSRRWIVAGKEPATTERSDRLAVKERIIVVPAGVDIGR
jgi:hypothetical protein